MLSKVVKISIVLLCLLSLAIPTTATSAAGDIPPIAGAPECPDTNGDGHSDVTDNPDYGRFPDNQLYHDLWNEKAGCHYDHEHGDNPALADSFFGKAGQLWGGLGIGYPFYTSAMENTHKHSGFKYYVRTPQFNPFPPCGTENVSDNNQSGFGNNCVLAARVVLHTIAGTMDTLARYHSGYIEAYLCKYPEYTSCGTVKTGGWFDFAELKAPHYNQRVIRPGGTVDFGDGVVMDYAPDGPDLPAMSGEPYVFMIDYNPTNLAEYRAHPPTAPKATMDQWSSNDFDCEPRPAGDPCHNQYTHLLVQVGDSWNLMDRANPNNLVWICKGEVNCEYNGSLTGLNELWIKVLQAWQPSGNGFVTLTGWSDRWGNPRFDGMCTSVAVDCVPFVLDHAPVGTAAVRNDPGCECFVVEHDIYFNGQPSNWIEFLSHAPHSSPPTNTPPVPTSTPVSSDPFVSTEVDPTSLNMGGTARATVKLNNVPAEGYKSAEFSCTYDAALVEKSNIVPTNLFGADPVVAIHDPQNGAFIVAIAGTNSNRATTSGPAFTFSAKGLQAGQSQIQCTARVSKGDNMPIDLPSNGASLAIQGAETPTSTPGDHEHPIPTSIPLESPTPVPSPNGSINGQIIASKPVTVSLVDANNATVTSVVANPDGTFNLTALGGNYTLLATASGFLSHQGSVTITAGNTSAKPAIKLLAGDVDGNSVIDQFDALTVGMSYTSSTPTSADLNNDGVIDFLDLELLAENYRKTGPSVWE